MRASVGDNLHVPLTSHGTRVLPPPQTDTSRKRWGGNGSGPYCQLEIPSLWGCVGRVPWDPQRHQPPADITH